MKIFIDISTGQPWQFEDDDDVRFIDGVYQVFSASGDRIISVPETLKPAPEDWTPPAPEPQPITVFSSLDYLQKFTTDEYAAARNHANVSVQFGLDMLIAAQYVDLDDPRVAMTLDLLVTEGVVTPERRTELLTPQAV